MSAPPAPVIPDIVEEHLEEFGFLSLTRRKLIVDWESDLPDLAEHDERIEAHRDALRVAGDASVQLALSRFEDPLSAWDTYACARVVLEQGDPSPDQVREWILGTDVLETLPGWREAFRRTSRRALDLLPAQPTAEKDSRLRSLTIDAAGWHGRLAAPARDAALADPDPSVRLAAVRSLPWENDASRDPGAVLAGRVRDEDEGVRRAALWSLALAAPDAARSIARSEVASDAPDPFFVRVLGLFGDASDRPRLERLGLLPAALRALGDLGDAGALPHLTEALEDESAALPAAEAVSRIAGFPDGHSDEPDEEILDVDAYRAYARERASALPEDTRLLRGRPFPPAEPDEEEMTEAVWRRLVRSGRGAGQALGREVPDGFFSGAPGEESECGV